jgi:hypothetical protein
LSSLGYWERTLTNPLPATNSYQAPYQYESSQPYSPQQSLAVLGSAPTPPPPPPTFEGSAGSRIVDAVASTGGVQRTKFEYPTELPAIPPDLLTAFANQRRLGTAAIENAELYRSRGLKEAEARKLTAQADLSRQLGRETNTTMASYASGGRARSPLGVNQSRAEIASGGERQQTLLEEQLAQLMTELDRMVSDARLGKLRTDADIDMQMAQYRTNSALENLRQKQSIDLMNWQMGLV